MRRLIIILGAFGALLLAPRAHACLHVGEGQTISQTGQQIIAVWDDGREDLILGVDYTAEQAPEAIGMVVPVPSVPIEYGALDPALMPALREWVNLRWEQHARARGEPQALAAAAAEPPVRELEPARAGPYEIQPLQASGVEAASALNVWLDDHGMSTIPEAPLRYYIERGWTFLAVRVVPEEGQAALAEAGGLPPLRISFPTDRAVVPLRLEAQGAPFEVSVHLITTTELADEAFEGARARGFTMAGYPGRDAIPTSAASSLECDRGRFRRADLPEAMKDLVERFGEEQDLYLRVLHAANFGVGVAAPMSWDEELSVPGLDEGERLEGAGPGQEPEAEAEDEEDEGEADEAEEAEPEEAAEAEGEEAPAADVQPSPSGCGGCRVGARSPAPLAWLALGLGLWVWRRR